MNNWRLDFFLLSIIASKNHHNHYHGVYQTNKDGSPLSKCLLFAPAEYFNDTSAKIQLVRTLSSSFRINTNNNSSTESNDDQLPSSQQQQQQPSTHTSEISPPLVYILCVPISVELESEWRGKIHTISENKNLTSILPLHTHWKTTTVFLLTQQTNHLEKFEESFKERLLKINVQQSDLYNFETKTGQLLLQKRSCFEKTDNAMRTLAHSILSLSNCIASNVEQFEKMIEKINTRDYVVRTKQHKLNMSIISNVHVNIFKDCMNFTITKFLQIYRLFAKYFGLFQRKKIDKYFNASYFPVELSNRKEISQME